MEKKREKQQNMLETVLIITGIIVSLVDIIVCAIDMIDRRKDKKEY